MLRRICFLCNKPEQENYVARKWDRITQHTKKMLGISPVVEQTDLTCAGNQLPFPSCDFFLFSFLSFFFFKVTPRHMEFPGPALNRSCSCSLSRAMQQQIRAIPVNYNNSESLTYWARPGIRPASSQRQRQVLNLLNHNGNSSLCDFLHNLPISLLACFVDECCWTSVLGSMSVAWMHTTHWSYCLWLYIEFTHSSTVWKTWVSLGKI